MQWYYSSKGEQLGPVSEAELREKVQAGEVGADDLVWADGMGDWQPVSKTAALSTALAAPATVNPQGAPPSSGVGQTATPSPYQAPSAQGPGSGPIQNYLWQSIVVTLFCCTIFGIVGIVYAAKVDGLQRAGDYAGAQEAADNAKKWCIWGAICGFIVIAIYAVAIATGGIEA